MSYISVKTEESEDAAKKFDEHGTTIQYIIDDIQNSILNGLPGWQGVAKEAFVAQFTRIKPHLQSFVTLAQGQAIQLRDHISGSEEHDNYYAQQFTGGY